MTLMPGKHVPIGRSLVGIGALILRELRAPSTVSVLWERVRENPEIGSYRNFVMALNYLFAIAAIDYEDGILSRNRQ